MQYHNPDNPDNPDNRAKRASCLATARRTHAIRPWWLPIALGSSIVLAACGDSGTVTGETGGAGGGGEDGGPSPVASYVGLWDITGNWSGDPNLQQDGATLVVRPLGEDDNAEVVIYDLDEQGGQNCYFTANATGEASESPIDGRVFLDRLPDFLDAVLSLTNNGNTLTLQYADLNDIDDDGDTGDTVSYQATRLQGQAEIDIPICSQEF